MATITTDDRYTTVSYPEHTATVVETRVIDGITVDVLQTVWIEQATVDAEPVAMLGKFEAVEAGDYTISAPMLRFYLTDQGYTNFEGAYVTYAKAGARSSSDGSYARGTATLADRAGSVKDAFAKAAKAIARRRHFETFGPVAVAATRTLTRDQVDALDLIGDDVAVGDLVVAHLFNQWRVGVVTKIGPKNVTIMYATPSGGVPMEKAIKRESVRQVRKAEPTPAPAADAEVPATEATVATEAAPAEQEAGKPAETPVWRLDMEPAAQALGICLHLTTFEPADGGPITCDGCDGTFATREVLTLSFRLARARVWLGQTVARREGWAPGERADLDDKVDFHLGEAVRLASELDLVTARLGLVTARP